MAAKIDKLKSWKVELETKVSELKKKVDELSDQHDLLVFKIEFLGIFGDDYRSLILNLIKEVEGVSAEYNTISAEHDYWDTLLFRVSSEIDLCNLKKQ